MSPDDYKRAAELFEQLRDLPEGERAAVLDGACGADAGLRAQVQRLIEANRQAAADSFLSRHAIADAARPIEPVDRRPPQPGALIGGYRLGARIGAGGMGVVFEGRDLRLDRRVAIKILTSPLGGVGDEAVKRFRRESRAASLLNHPNIVSIFDADTDAGRGASYIVMEFIEGKTLRDIIDFEPRRLDPQIVLEIIAQTAAALSAAHEAGIVHRDIKPENIMVRPDGFVKVLDFGLAKLRERRDSAAVAPELRTRPGHVAGTIQYLSPEQVAGGPVDARSDMFSLGVVAYELATGKRPFGGATDGAIYDAVLHHTPTPPSVLRSAFGAEFDGLVMRALEKDPELRFQTAADLRSACKLLGRASSPPHAVFVPPAARRPRLTSLLGIAAGLVLVAASLGAYWTLRQGGRTQGPLPVRFEKLTGDPGEERFPNLSPDGRQFIYAGAARGNWDIYFQRTGGVTAVNLTPDSAADDKEPALSRDGQLIAFRSERDGGGLFVMEATGENPRRVSTHGYLPSWSPDGKALVYSDQTFEIASVRGAPTSRLHIVELDTGRRTDLRTGDAVQPAWSPHGDRIAYWGIDAGGQRDLFTIGARGDVTSPVQVTKDPAIDWNPVWSPSGEELYFISNRGGTMSPWRVRIDERTGRTRGQPEPVTTPAESVGHISFSASGGSFLYSQVDTRIHLFSIGYDKSRLLVRGSPTPVGADGSNVTNVWFSPDQQRIVYDTVGEKVEDIWIMNKDGSGRRRLTSDPYKDRGPAWSPGGEEIAFYSDRTGRYELWAIRPDGSAMRQLTSITGPKHVQMPVWSRDGRLLFSPRTPGSPVIVDPHRSSPARDPQPPPGLENFDRAFFGPAPDRGDWMVIDTGDPALPDLLLYSYPDGKVQPLGVKGRSAAFLPDARQIVYARETSCFVFDLATRREQRLFSVAPNEIYMLAPANDGRIYFTQTTRNADLWIAHMK